MSSRRAFFRSAGGLLLAASLFEPERAYSFLWAPPKPFMINMAEWKGTMAEAVDAVDERGVIWFPSGTYHLKERLIPLGQQVIMDSSWVTIDTDDVALDLRVPTRNGRPHAITNNHFHVLAGGFAHV